MVAASRTWIVIPTYNEAENLRALVAAIRAAVAATILVVDDNSPDGTGGLADVLAASVPDVHVLHRPAKAGLAAAYTAGFQRALVEGADYVLEMDADFSHDPSDLPRLLEAAGAGADVVLGSRYVPGGGVEGWSADRQILSRAGGLYARVVLGSSVRDLTGGFKCFRADALRVIGIDDLTADGYAFQVETTFRAERAGLRVEEVPIVFRERQAGRSKMSPAIAAEAIWRIPRMRLSARRHGAPAPAVTALPH
ncbi:MAG: polyprenol monophosphomannose synthase [Solirubrobacteraceae bacterium]